MTGPVGKGLGGDAVSCAAEVGSEDRLFRAVVGFFASVSCFRNGLGKLECLMGLVLLVTVTDCRDCRFSGTGGGTTWISARPAAGRLVGPVRGALGGTSGLPDSSNGMVWDLTAEG